MLNIKAVVLSGGLSHERDVSLCSGSLIANALRNKGVETAWIDIYEGIEDKVELESLFKGKEEPPYIYKIPETEPNLQALKERHHNGLALIGPRVIELCNRADKVFIALHGDMGENGQIQATLDVLGIPYTGTGYKGSLLAMDKELSKKLMVNEDIKTPKWHTLTNKSQPLDAILQELSLPIVVKPSSNGSSIGISIVNNKKELMTAIDHAMTIESKVLIEEMIQGREFSVGTLQGEALPVIEIIPKSGFYDYKNKYQTGCATEICPAQLSPEATNTIQKQALKIHATLELGSYSRIDFIMDNKGDFYCLEANTLPGMTPTSLLPQEAKTAGITYEDLCLRILSI